MTPQNPAVQFLINRAGRVYTAGRGVEQARAVCERLGNEGIASTMCYWNHHLDPPSLVADSYIRILELIRDTGSDCYLSVKAPALAFKMDLLQRIFDAASRANTIVHFDAMAPETVDRTFAMIEEAHRRYSYLSCTLPARWRRSVRDVDRVVDLGLRVRVVKGQWSGLNGDDTDPAEGFRAVVDRLAARGARHVAIATHNLAIAADTLRRLKTSGTSCELELLYALPRRKMLKIARECDVPTRVYVPYGHAALPYRLKEAGRDPRILAWFVRDLIRA